MDLGNGLGHLTYSTLVHPGDNWDELWTSLTTYLPQVKARVSPDEPFGVSLRLSAASARTLAGERGAARRAEALPRRQRPVPLHGQRVSRTGRSRAASSRSRSTSPTGAPSERTRYTIDVADILADVVARRHRRRRSRPRRSASSRTSPGPTSSPSYTEHVLRVAAHLVRLEQRTGRTVTLAIEPEPHCFLETTDETVAYFERAPLLRGGRAHARRSSPRIPISEAHVALRRHLGIVFDICHQAVEYEDIRDVAAEARRRRHPDLQAPGSRGAAHPRGDGGGRRGPAARYAETVYLTQTLEREGRPAHAVSSTSRTRSRPGRPSPARASGAPTSTCRCSSTTSGVFRTTRFALEDALAFHQARRRCRAQLEIETYTWDVLPDHLKTGDIVDYVCREIEWVRGQLPA